MPVSMTLSNHSNALAGALRPRFSGSLTINPVELRGHSAEYLERLNKVLGHAEFLRADIEPRQGVEMELTFFSPDMLEIQYRVKTPNGTELKGTLDNFTPLFVRGGMSAAKKARVQAVLEDLYAQGWEHTKGIGKNLKNPLVVIEGLFRRTQIHQLKLTPKALLNEAYFRVTDLHSSLYGSDFKAFE